MAHEIVRFTLADPHLAKLKELVGEEGSLHLTAKRLLISVLDGSQNSEVPDDLKQSLDEIFARLEKLEGGEARLDRLESNLNESAIADSDLLERLEARFKSIEHWLKSLTDRLDLVGNQTESRSEPQLSKAPICDRDSPAANEMFLVCEVNSAKAIIWYWGEKDWTKDRNEAKIYSTEASAKKAVSNLKKKVPDADIRWNSLERIMAIESR